MSRRGRQPETTALYQVVQQHLETYLALAEEASIVTPAKRVDGMRRQAILA